LVVTSDTLAPNEKDYISSFRANYKGFDFSFTRANISPTILQSNHQSNFFKWDKDFKSSLSNVLNVSYKMHFKNSQYLLFMGNYTDIYRYIYFNTENTPTQSEGNNGYYTLALGGRIKMGKFNFEPLVRYSEQTGENFLRVPKYWGMPSFLRKSPN
jgi:hypothetical protein